MNSSMSQFSQADGCLFDQARAGDPLALGPLLASYADQLRQLADRQLDGKVRNRVSPSDIVQEALLQASQDFPGFRGQSDAELSSWLRRVLARKVSKTIERHLLAEKRDVRREVAFAPVADWSGMPVSDAVADHRPGPASEALGSERHHQLQHALAELPENYRRIIELRNIHGLPFEEIASRLNRSSGAARMLWLRAIEALRQRLSPQESK